jgi:hypothetical protein
MRVTETGTQGKDLHIDFRLDISAASGRPSLTIVVDDFPAATLLPIFAAAVLSSLQSALARSGLVDVDERLH